jgi:hypothetical protein
MAGRIRRLRCSTKKCTGFIDTNVSTTPKSKDGNWQFHCSVCGFWNLLSETGMMKATSHDEFDLQQLPSSLRGPFAVTRSPSGGV